jgi:tagatose 1,6-diphosphate aldolase
MRTYSAPQLGELKDRDLRLVLRDVTTAIPERQWVPDMRFNMRLTGVGEPVGRIQLRLGLTDELLQHAGQIGYIVEEPYRGQRLAARAVALLLPVARAAGMEEIWITCDPENIASRRTLEIAGGELVEEREIAEWSPMRIDGRTHVCRFRFTL